MWKALGIAMLIGCTGGSGTSNHEGGGKIGDATCALGASVSGAADWALASAPACVIAYGPDVGMDMVYAPLGEGVDDYSILVPSIPPGGTGAFDAEVHVNVKSLGRFVATDCSIDVASDDHQSDDGMYATYRVEGTGTCAGAATLDTMELAIDPFAFRFSPKWPE